MVQPKAPGPKKDEKGPPITEREPDTSAPLVSDDPADGYHRDGEGDPERREKGADESAPLVSDDPADGYHRDTVKDD